MIVAAVQWQPYYKVMWFCDKCKDLCYCFFYTLQGNEPNTFNTEGCNDKEGHYVIQIPMDWSWYDTNIDTLALIRYIFRYTGHDMIHNTICQNTSVMTWNISDEWKKREQIVSSLLTVLSPSLNSVTRKLKLSQTPNSKNTDGLSSSCLFLCGLGYFIIKRGQDILIS